MAMDIVSILDRIEALISTSLKVPATQRTFLDTKKLQELVDQLRMAVPQDVKSAKEILAKKDDIVNQAELERRKIRSTAEEEFRNRLNQTEVMKEAQRKAAEMMEEAEQKSQRALKHADTEVKSRKAEVDAYSIKTLRKLERQLTANLTSIRNGLALLSGIDTFEVVATGNGSGAAVKAEKVVSKTSCFFSVIRGLRLYPLEVLGSWRTRQKNAYNIPPTLISRPHITESNADLSIKNILCSQLFLRCICLRLSRST